jgi:hypothetical protein
MTRDEIIDLQSRLVALGFGPLKLDGIPGPATSRAVAAFQRAAGLPDDGIAGPATLTAIEAVIPTVKNNLDVAIAEVADSIGVSERSLRAVMAVESSGRGLGTDGKPVIRLELHLLKRRIPKPFEAGIHCSFRIDGPKPWEGHSALFPGGWLRIHEGGQSREWDAYQLAVTVGAGTEAPAASSSWGAAQILGSHHARLGYATATAMAIAFKSEPEQIRAFGRFLVTGADLVWAARDQNWEVFAKEYNGSGQVAYYAGALAKAYSRLA